ncbi:MAG: type II secretion system protein [bacterium]|nr:type II secretion system protein [bacterium]
MFNVTRKGFTLIEILVVIAIISGLSAVLLPNFMGARERGRDSQRKNDLKQIQNALELYKQDASPIAFPTTLPSSGLCWSSGGAGASCPAGTTYINKFPGDPTLKNPDASVKGYYFSPINTSLTYTLCACLENIADSDGSAGNCDGLADGSSLYKCSPGKKYVVTEP